MRGRLGSLGKRPGLGCIDAPCGRLSKYVLSLMKTASFYLGDLHLTVMSVIMVLSSNELHVFLVTDYVCGEIKQEL